MADNEPLSGITHLIGTILGIAGLIILIVLAVRHASVWHIVGFSIFGASLILLYLSSTLYHLIPIRREIFRKIDHSMIFVLIAGTYTPLCITVLRGGMGWSIFGIVWGIAIIGIIMKITSSRPIKPWVSTLIYIAMGWIMIVAISPLSKILPAGAIFLLFTGGILYTIGTIFYGLGRRSGVKRIFGMHEIFHLFVLTGSFSHYLLMIKYVLYI